MALLLKIFLWVYSTTVPNFMLLSSNAEYAHIMHIKAVLNELYIAIIKVIEVSG